MLVLDDTTERVERQRALPAADAPPSPQSVEVQYTHAVSATAVSKCYGLDATGKPAKISGDKLLFAGTAYRKTLRGHSAYDCLLQLSDDLERYGPRDMLIPGSPPAGSDEYPIVAERLLPLHHGAITRSKADLQHEPGRPALLVFDFDFPDQSSVELPPGGTWPAVLQAVPQLEGVARLARVSMSASVRHRVTGEYANSSPRVHVFVVLDDASQLRRVALVIRGRLIIAGYCYPFVSKAGRFECRPIVDFPAMASAERIFYEGEPVLESDLLIYDREKRKPIVLPGGVLVANTVPDLTPSEERQIEVITEAVRQRPEVQAEIATHKAASRERQREMSSGRFTPTADEYDVALETGRLEGEFRIQFDDGEIATADDVALNPYRYQGRTLPDPLDPEYGRNKAKVLPGGKGGPVIHSFAHGGRVYEVVASPEAKERWVAQWFEPADPQETEAVRSEWLDLSVALIGHEPQPRRWVVEGFVPENEVTVLYGDGGMGKTLAAQQLGTAVSLGAPWLGQSTQQCRVMGFFCEDSADELLRRQIDINRALGVVPSDLGSFRIASRRHHDNVLALWDRGTGAMKLQPAWHRLRDDALEFGARLLILDTIADLFAGNEIDRAQVTSFVKSCLGRLAHDIGGTVLALGHPSMSGKQSGSGTSGSTAWSNAVRSRLYLRYPKGVEKGNIRELEGMKLNYGPKGNLLKLRWNKGAFDVVAASIQGERQYIDSDTLRTGFATVEDACEAAVIDAVLAATDATLSRRPNSIHFAPKVLKAREPDLLVAFGTDEIDAALTRLITRGALVETEVGRDRARRPLLGLAVVQDKLSVTSAVTSAGVFS